MKDIDDYIDELIALMGLDELVVWANNLDVEVNYPPIDDMYSDWQNELAVSVGEALLKNLSLKQYKQLQTEVEKHRWIPVEEGLPKNSDRLLAYGKDGFGYKIVIATTYDHEFKKFRILTDVTHWKSIILPTTP